MSLIKDKAIQLTTGQIALLLGLLASDKGFDDFCAASNYDLIQRGIAKLAREDLMANLVLAAPELFSEEMVAFAKKEARLGFDIQDSLQSMSDSLQSIEGSAG